MTTQSGSIDGIPYASSKYVYDTDGDGIVTEILYYDQTGHQVADRSVFGFPTFASTLKTVNPDGSFTLKITPAGAHGGIDEGYDVETFSSAGIWQREDVYAPIYIDPSNPGGGVSFYTETAYTIANVMLGNSGTISGTYYDKVQTHYTGSGRIFEIDYLNDLNDSQKVVATTYEPNPVLNVPMADRATAGSTLQLYISMSDPWAANHAGSLALTISTDGGTVSGTDSAGHAFSVTAGNAAHLTGTLAQINSDLASLTFIDQAAGTTHVNFTVYDQAGLSDSKRDTITVSGSPPPPPTGLSGPTSLTIPADTLLHDMKVSYYDPWAANHVGSLALNVTTTLGTLTDVAAGHSTSGTSLHLTGSYSQIEADVSGLALTSSQAGTGSVRVEVYNQAGVESVHVIGVTAQTGMA